MGRLTSMGDEGPRYGVFFVPAQESDFFRFGSTVLGYDCYSGGVKAAPEEFSTEAAQWAQLTETPRRYGFHATLKAPFHLLPSCTEAQLVSAFRSFAGLGRVAPVIRPVLQVLGDFVAVVPEQPSSAVDSLAGDCTMIFDAFRAPMSPQERARRVATGLSHRQIQNLDRWGYAHLFTDFRFHMTLTGPVEPRLRNSVLATLRAVFQRMCGGLDTVPVDRLALVKQATVQSAFRVLTDAPLLRPR